MFFKDRSKQLFEETLQLVRAADLQIASHHYDRKSFGNWYIELANGLRIGWDGRDKFATIGEYKPGYSAVFWDGGPTRNAEQLRDLLVYFSIIENRVPIRTSTP